MVSFITTILCLFIFYFSGRSLGTSVGHLYVQYENLQNFRFDDFRIKTLSVETFPKCALECESEVSCLSIQYNSNTSSCRLFETLYLSAILGHNESGWTYLVNTQGRCRQGFTEVQVFNKCLKFIGFYTCTEGKDICRAYNSSLIDITSQAEQVFVEKIAETFYGYVPKEHEQNSTSYFSHMYIQGTFNGSDWLLDNGDVMTFTKWSPGRVQKKSSFVNIRITKEGNEYFWYDAIGKSIQRAVICSYRTA